MPKDAASSRMVNGHSYATEPVEARVGTNRFMLLANFYYDQPTRRLRGDTYSALA